MTADVLIEAPVRNKSKRRRLLSLAVLAGVVAGGAGVTAAQFTDTETVPQNTFTAGTLDLTAGQSAVTSVNFDNLAPGDQEVRQVSVGNAGSLDLKYRGSLVVHATKGLDRDGVADAETQKQNTAGVAGKDVYAADTSVPGFDYKLIAGSNVPVTTAKSITTADYNKLAATTTFAQDEGAEGGAEYNVDAPGSAYLPIKVVLKNAAGATVWSVDNLATYIAANKDGAGDKTVTINATNGDATIALPQSAFAVQYLASDADKHTYTDTAIEKALNGTGKHTSDTLTTTIDYPLAKDAQGKDIPQNAEQGASASFDFTFSAQQVANNTVPE